MNTASPAAPVPFAPLTLRERAFYFWSAAFVIGNLALPQLSHLAPLGGKTLLPVYFFTLIAAVRCGWRAGVLVALASPLLNHALFGMPPAAMLPVILAKSLLIAALAPLITRRLGVTLAALALAVAAYQLAGGLFEWAWTRSPAAALQDIAIGWPGMLLQVIGGLAVLRLLAKQLPPPPPHS
ncbi:MAG: ECF transporter S component [Opitutaceae bacterium]|jgi:hypothetical protein|nr:ECF transporter S component [Opitutaceae bacterium]